MKLAVTGTGPATKEQVEYMVMSLLKITERHRFLDATDALATALCHSGRVTRPTVALKPTAASKPSARKARTWKEFVEQNPDRVIVQNR